MREAKSLGIPLRQPGTGRRAQRRCSISQLTDADAADDCNVVWSCSHCQRTVVEKPRPLRAPDTAPPVLHKTASPFKDMFRMANFFGRKAKDDSRAKVKQTTLTLPRGHAARSSALCDVCGQTDVTSSPSAGRRTEMANVAGGPRTKYKRSASTPRPGGDGRLQLHSACDTPANRPARRKYSLEYGFVV